jgi:N,N'-diacetylchitobiose transport system substrate-binding protein
VKTRHLIAVGLAAVLTATACGGGNDKKTDTSASSAAPAVETTASSSAPAAADTTGNLTIWLMSGSQPDTVVKAINAEFKAKYPKVNVKVELQEWTGIQEKTTAALASNAPPDVLEIGNTLTSKFSASGGLLDLTDKKADLGGDAWLKGLEESGTFEGKLYGVPYYAGDRGVIYRKDMFAKAGVTPPKTRDELIAVGEKLKAANKSIKGFSALYFPGKYWYAALPFIWDEGGDLAVKDGDKWKGALDTPESIAALTWLKGAVDKLSSAPKDGDELKDADVFRAGKAAMIIDPGWQVGVILDPKTGDPKLKDKIGVFPIPGKTADKSAPVFLGGSTLSVSAGSKNPDLATEWLKLLASEKYQTDLAKAGNIPNTTTLLDVKKDDPILSVFFEAAKNSRFTPATPNWANVESSTILQDMLVSIFTGKKSIEAATKEASAAITTTLNG